MLYWTHIRLFILGLNLSLIALTACSGGPREVAGSGPPATESEIKRMLAGNSFDTHVDGQIFQSANGTLLSFSYPPDGPHVCEGRWRVDGSEEINVLNCKWVKGGRIYATKNKEKRYQYRLSSAHGMDMIGENGVFLGFLPYKFGKTYGSAKYRGFPRWQEFDDLSKQLGLRKVKFTAQLY